MYNLLASPAREELLVLLVPLFPYRPTSSVKDKHSVSSFLELSRTGLKLTSEEESVTISWSWYLG